MKNERPIQPNFVKLGVNKTIGHINKRMEYEESQINNEMTTCADEY